MIFIWNMRVMQKLCIDRILQENSRSLPSTVRYSVMQQLTRNDTTLVERRFNRNPKSNDVKSIPVYIVPEPTKFTWSAISPKIFKKNKFHPKKYTISLPMKSIIANVLLQKFVPIINVFLGSLFDTGSRQNRKKICLGNGSFHRFCSSQLEM